LAAVEILAPVMPHQSPLDIATSDRSLDNHRVHGGRCHVNPLSDVGDVLFPLVMPQWRKDVRGVPRRRDPSFHGIDAAALCKAMVDYRPSQVGTVLDGLDDREFTVVGEQLRRVDAFGQSGRLRILAPDGEGEVGPLGSGAPGPVGVGGHRDLLTGAGVELGEPLGLCVGQGRAQSGHANRAATRASGDGHRIQGTLDEHGAGTTFEPDKA
jgi:hypothetical protein